MRKGTLSQLVHCVASWNPEETAHLPLWPLLGRREKPIEVNLSSLFMMRHLNDGNTCRYSCDYWSCAYPWCLSAPCLVQPSIFLFVVLSTVATVIPTNTDIYIYIYIYIVTVHSTNVLAIIVLLSGMSSNLVVWVGALRLCSVQRRRRLLQGRWVSNRIICIILKYTR